MRKLFETAVLRRMTDQNLSNRQAGFRAKMGTIHHNVNLDMAIRQLQCEKLTLAFLDIKKAYDNVPREILWRKIEEKNNGALKPLLLCLRNLFDRNTPAVESSSELSKPRWWSKGLAQGSRLSPILFNNYIDDVASAVESACGTRM